jgi:alkanesulfonate monooxygenase SsuD/methylene tetrahydromethanopterin reductase-like flavin-dependent oxidoreductase (luciferase family)
MGDGNLDADCNAMFVEASTRSSPCGRGCAASHQAFWNISTERTLLREAGQGVMVKPYQKPHPPIVVTVVVPNSKGVEAAAKRGWTPISANFLQPVWVATHFPMYEKGCLAAGLQADRADWRVCKTFLSPTTTTARRYAKRLDGAYGFYYWNLLSKAGRRAADVYKQDSRLTRQSRLSMCWIRW